MERGKRTLTAIFEAEDADFVRFCAQKAGMTISKLIECVVMHDLEGRPQIVREYEAFINKEDEKRIKEALWQ